MAVQPAEGAVIRVVPFGGELGCQSFVKNIGLNS